MQAWPQLTAVHVVRHNDAQAERFELAGRHRAFFGKKDDFFRPTDPQDIVGRLLYQIGHASGYLPFQRGHCGERFKMRFSICLAADVAGRAHRAAEKCELLAERGFRRVVDL